MTTAADLARQLQAKSTGPGAWMARCPAHEDKTASLSIGQGEDGRLLLNCFAGCDFADILEAAGVEPSRANGEDRTPKPRIVATYDYRDAAGEILFQVVRLAPKDFRQRRPDGKGWIWNTRGVELVPYRLPEVIEASEVYIVEGEKDADALAKLGLAATTNPRGAGKWPKVFAGWFDGRHVRILPDHDEPGRKHARDVAAKLRATAASIKVVELPGLPDKGDVSDWLAAGGTAAELRALAEAAPYWDADGEPAEADSEEQDGADQPYSFTMLRDLEPALERRELVKGVIPYGGFGVAYAEAGAGKTAIIVDIALHIASGIGYRGRRVEQQPVVFVALEGHAGIGNRIIAAAAELGVTDAPFALVKISANFRDRGASRRIAAVANKMGGHPLIVVDTLTAALAGGSDCDPSDVGALIEAVKAELLSYGCTVLIIHHTGKDSSRGSRGWSGLLGACDFELELSRADELRTLRVSKMRDGSDAQLAFCYQLYPVELGKDQYGDPVTAVCVEHLADQEQAKKGKRVSPKARAALNVMWQMIKDRDRSFPLPDAPGLRCVLLSAWEAECITVGGISKSLDLKQRRRLFREALTELESAATIIRDSEGGERVYPAPRQDG